ncbi:rap guanine nucleotide exchange factor 3 [Tachyglossus aculeatus]|uniref:rap guanine nucleotide exchange factor 3 n=1 Tax=Tachyglossus aculeatus TaxID=9261 RepID=UPI0018F5CEAE|nr:rap guanine nucleotide exchange factor 3 [Tachyglossus aculeatus]
MKVGWPGEGRWQAGWSDGRRAGGAGGLPDVVPAGTLLLAMALRRVPRPRTNSYELEPERGPPPGRIQGLRWTPLNDNDETLNSSPGLAQATVLRAAKLLYGHLLDTCPALVRDRKHHLRLYRQCCSGRELVDGLLATGFGIQSRSQAVGICQVLLDEGVLHHVKDDWHFQDRDAQFYRFSVPELWGLPGEVPGGNLGGEREAEELAEAMGLLSQRGSDALLTMALRKPLGQRSDEELELIFEELLHIKAVAHLSNSVKRELAAVMLFESHRKAGTVLFSQGDTGTSWYVIWKGSVNVVTHGKGLVTTLHEGDAFGQLALVNEAPRAATIVLREDNCHFLRVDKRDFTRILKDVEAKTLRLEEHGKVVLVLEREPQGTGRGRPAPPTPNRYTVMSGTPEKILELLLEAVRPDSCVHDPTDTFLGDFLLTHGIFMPSTQLCAALLHHFHAEPATGSETDRSLYVGHRRQRILHLVSQWVALYGPMLDADPAAPAFLQKLSELVSQDARLCQLLREQGPEKRRPRGLENGGGGNGSSQMKAGNGSIWFPGLDEASPSGCLAIRAQDRVPYAVCRPDHEVLTVLLPVTASAREVTAAVAQVDSRTGDPVLVKVNSSGEVVKLPLDARGVASSLGLNERLFLVSAQEPAVLTPHPDQLGPNVGSAELLDAVSSRDLASLLSEYDWGLFHCVHQVEPILYVQGPQRLRDITTANLERLMRRFNELQYWVATELCLCPLPAARARLLSRFIKLAAHLKEQRNLNSFFAVMFGLSNSAISRLARTWERLPHKVRKLHSSLEQLLDPSWNHRVYRLALAKLSPPIIPFMPLLLKDMTFIHDGNRTMVENLINFEKMRMMARAVRMLHHCRNHSQAPLSPLRNRPSPNREEAKAMRISTCTDQAPRAHSPATASAYLQNLRVIDNQRELSRLSRKLEP